MTVVVAFTSLATPAQAALHDGCIGGGNDAANTYDAASRLRAPRTCDGEMHVQLDPADWYYAVIPATQSTGSLTVTVCPTAIKTSPWNPDLELYFQQGAGLHLQLGKLLGPGTLMGKSTNASGCDTVSATVGFPGGPIANGGRWNVFVKRTAGDGFYDLTLA